MMQAVTRGSDRSDGSAAMMSASPEARGTLPRFAVPALLLLYAALLLLLRPATPFEWDEVLFQEALDHYDVGQHWPHPPGYPVYVAVGKLVRVVVGDPLVALQVVGVLAAVGALVTVIALMRRFGAPSRTVLAAVALLALNPAFVFYANVGLSDVPGAAATFGACLALLWASEEPVRLPLAAVVCAVALGVRPQLVAVLLPLGVFALFRAARERRWSLLVRATIAGLAATAACWLPAILVTGTQRFVTTWQNLAAWAATAERGYRMPVAPIKEVLAYWLVRPFGPAALAAVFWVLVILGARTWWRTGHRRLVWIAASSAVCYVLFGMFSMNFTTAVRYVLPALPFLALLAAGVANATTRTSRRVGTAVLAVSVVAGAVWVTPPFLLRLHPAPVWEALEWVTHRFERAKTTVVYDQAIRPHGMYVLARAKFDAKEARPATAYDASLRPHGQVLVVSETPIPGFPVIFERRWDSDRFRRLTRNRYNTGVVMTPPGPDQPVFSPDWRAEEGRWHLLGTGLVHLPATAHPAVLRLCAGWFPLVLAQAGFPDFTVGSHDCVERALAPGTAGDLTVIAPEMTRPSMPAGEVLPLRLADAGSGPFAKAYMTPLVAHVPGRDGALWVTDLVLANPHTDPLPIAAAFLPSSHENASAPRLKRVLGPGEVLELDDVLFAPQLVAAGDLGALLVVADESAATCRGNACGFLVFSHTYNKLASGQAQDGGEWLPGLPPEAGIRPGGRAEFPHLSLAPNSRLSIGLASWTDAPVRVRGTLLGTGGQATAWRMFDVPRFGHLHLPLDLKLRDNSIVIELEGPPSQALVYAYLAIVDGATDRATYLQPRVSAGKASSAVGEPPLPSPEGGR